MEKLVNIENGKVDGMFCRYEECCTTEDICPNLQLDNCECLKEALKRLAEYQNAEDEGLMKILPVAIGSDVYFIPSKVNYDLNVLSKHEENNRVYHQKVAKITFTERGWYLELDKNLEYGVDHIFVDKFYKETWFTSSEEAEQALADMQCK